MKQKQIKKIASIIHIKEFAEKVKALIDERKYKAGFSANMLRADTAQGCVDEIAKEYGAEVVE